MNALRWNVFFGTFGGDGFWRWTKCGSRGHSTEAKALARKLARGYQIKSDFMDGRAVGLTIGEWTPGGATLVCNRNGNFYPLQELWPDRTEGVIV